MTLSRGLTNAAFVEYLEADERMAVCEVTARRVREKRSDAQT